MALKLRKLSLFSLIFFLLTVQSNVQGQSNTPSKKVEEYWKVQEAYLQEKGPNQANLKVDRDQKLTELTLEEKQSIILEILKKYQSKEDAIFYHWTKSESVYQKMIQDKVMTQEGLNYLIDRHNNARGGGLYLANSINKAANYGYHLVEVVIPKGTPTLHEDFLSWYGFDLSGPWKVPALLHYDNISNFSVLKTGVGEVQFREFTGMGYSDDDIRQTYGDLPLQMTYGHLMRYIKAMDKFIGDRSQNLKLCYQ